MTENAAQLRDRDGEPLSASRALLWAAAIMLMTIVAYLPAVKGDFLWDDDDHITRNAAVMSPGGLPRIWFELNATPQYYPLVFSSFWLEYRCFQSRPLGYHVTNILLHGLGAVLLWLVLRRLAVPGAWVAAAVFALHPIHVESVAWITERKNVLSAFFYMLALLAYLRFSPLGEQGEARPNRYWRWFAPTIALFACALFSKTVTCSLPAVILVLTWWKHGRIAWRDVAPTLPMFVLGLAGGLLTAWMEQHYISRGQSEYDYSIIERCLIAGRVSWFYLGTIVWPVDLAFIYTRWSIDMWKWWQWLFPLGAVALLAALWVARRRIGRGPLAAVLFFGGTLFPALGFVDVFPFRFSFVADHFQHVASIGITTLLVALGARGARMINMPVWPNRAIVAAALLGALGFMTWNQCFIYRDPITLWRDTISKTPDSWMPHLNLGELLRRQGTAASLEEAIGHFEQAMAARPHDPDPVIKLGNTYLDQGRNDKALAMYDRAARIKPSADAWNNMGAAYSRMGRGEDAIASYRAALRVDPRNVAAYMNLGVAYVSRGMVNSATDEFRRALEIDSGMAASVGNIGDVLASRGDHAGAVLLFELALRFNPDDGRIKALRDRSLSRL